jgi:hypothetical protein
MMQRGATTAKCVTSWVNEHLIISQTSSVVAAICGSVQQQRKRELVVVVT